MRDALVGLEAEPTLRSRGLVRLRSTNPDTVIHLRLEDAAGKSIDAILTAPWGALALDPYVLDVGYQGRVRWIVDPFAFLERALAIAPGPVLDLTTEGGARLLVVTADADGASRRFGSPPVSAADVVLRDVLSPLQVATTVAVPLREFEPGAGAQPGPTGAGRALDAMLALPGVEAASHSHNHPAHWSSLSEEDMRREIEGSVDSPHHPCPPWPEAGPHVPVAGRRALGARRAVAGPPAGAHLPGEWHRPERTHLSRRALPVGPARRRPLRRLPSGTRRAGGRRARGGADLDRAHVAQLAQLAESPRRLGAIGIHYPFWLVSTPSAVRALKDTLRWALEQRARPLWASEYADKVEDFRRATVARRLEGGWSFRGLGGLRTVRLPRAQGWPDLERSRGVASVTEIGDSLYVSFASAERPLLVLSGEPTRGPFLAWTNARVAAWRPGGQGVSLRLIGHGPVRLDIAGVSQSCTLTTNGQTLQPSVIGGLQRFDVPDTDTGDATLECRG